MDFNQIRYFLALSETLNFSRAAESCNVTQPALTQAIKRLEDELGGRLIVRDGANTMLTELGIALHSQFRQLDHTRQLVRATATSIVTGTQATLNVGIMCTVGPRLIAKFLREFREKNPATMLVLHDVVPQNISELLITGSLDTVFCSRIGATEGRVRYIPLYDEEMVVAHPVDHAFSSLTSCSLQQIADQPYIDRLLCEFRERFFEHLDKNELAVDVAASSQREDWVQGLIADGMGISVMPQFSPISTGVATCAIDADFGRTVEIAVIRSASLSPALVRLIEHAETYQWPIADH